MGRSGIKHDEEWCEWSLVPERRHLDRAWNWVFKLSYNTFGVGSPYNTIDGIDIAAGSSCSKRMDTTGRQQYRANGTIGYGASLA